MSSPFSLGNEFLAESTDACPLNLCGGGLVAAGI